VFHPSHNTRKYLALFVPLDQVPQRKTWYSNTSHVFKYHPIINELGFTFFKVFFSHQTITDQVNERVHDFDQLIAFPFHQTITE
jgi:hypothetical protein